MKAGYTHNLCVDTHHDLCLLCASLCVPLRDFSLIKTDGAHNACVPVLPSGFEKENILMFARRSNTNGGDIVTGDWCDNAKWNSAVGICCKNVQCGNVRVPSQQSAVAPFRGCGPKKQSSSLLPTARRSFSFIDSCPPIRSTVKPKPSSEFTNVTFVESSIPKAS